MSAFEDFIQVELPRRPWVVDDPAQETIPVRRGAGPRQLEFVDISEGQVLGKVGGVIQGIDIATGSDIPKNYIHYESGSPAPADLWVITHNKDSEDFVIHITDETGNQIIPNEVTTVDADNVLIDFNIPTAGKAVLIFAS
jgi:hypothetical protein